MILKKKLYFKFCQRFSKWVAMGNVLTSWDFIFNIFFFVEIRCAWLVRCWLEINHVRIWKNDRYSYIVCDLNINNFYCFMLIVTHFNICIILRYNFFVFFLLFSSLLAVCNEVHFIGCASFDYLRKLALVYTHFLYMI